MDRKAKFAFYSFLFFLLFVLIGDTYILFVDNKISSSNYVFQVTIRDAALEENYVAALERYSKELNLQIYTFSNNVEGKNNLSFTLFCDNQTKTKLKQRLQIEDDITTIKSLISGKRTIEFKPFDMLTQTRTDERYYYVFGSKDAVEKLRSSTIDKYGTGRPEENDFMDDVVILLIAGGWLFIFLLIIVSTIFEVQNSQKEVLVRNINGKKIGDIVRPLIMKNLLLLVSSIGTGMLMASILTEAFKFIAVNCTLTALLIALTGLVFMSLFRLDIKKVFKKSSYSAGYQISVLLVLSFISLTLILSLASTGKNIADAYHTLTQEKEWAQFSSYDSIYFMFRGEGANSNTSKDCEYARKFYDENIDKYRLYLSFDIENNGGSVEGQSLSDKDSVLYLNKNALPDTEEIGVDISRIQEDRYYLISRYSDAELQAKGIYVRGDENSYIYYAFPAINEIGEPVEFNSITINKPYEFLVHDINMSNLADNYKKNPVIILDTHSTLPRTEMVVGEDTFALNAFNSLVKFNDEDDYNSFLYSIGADDEVHYKNNINELFLQKKQEKTLTFMINLSLSLLLTILFVLTLLSCLLIDFRARAIEVAIDKILGKSLLKRYKRLFSTLVLSFVLGLSLVIAYQVFFGRFNLAFIVPGMVIVFFTSLSVTLTFIRKYEDKNISLILKGGAL